MDVVYNAGQVPTELLRSDCFNLYVETEICKPNYLQAHTWLKHNKVDWRTKTAAHYYNYTIISIYEEAFAQYLKQMLTIFGKVVSG